MTISSGSSQPESLIQRSQTQFIQIRNTQYPVNLLNLLAIKNVAR